jgi:hypothetical protein
MRRAHQNPQTWNVRLGTGEDAQKIVIELPDRDLVFDELNANLLSAALQRGAELQRKRVRDGEVPGA